MKIDGGSPEKQARKRERSYIHERERARQIRKDRLDAQLYFGHQIVLHSIGVFRWTGAD